MNITSVKERLRDKKTILYILTFLILVFIWSNSMDHPSESYAKSNLVLEKVTAALTKIFGADHVLTVFFKSHVRKLAHFTEYMVLGSVITIAMKLSHKTRFQHFYNSLSFSVIVAVIDEFIQIYTYRGSSVRDVIIDFSGYFTGTVIVSFIITIITLIRIYKHR